MDGGLTRAEYDWFMLGEPPGHQIIGNDYYGRNEQMVMPGGERLVAEPVQAERVGKVRFGRAQLGNGPGQRRVDRARTSERAGNCRLDGQRPFGADRRGEIRINDRGGGDEEIVATRRCPNVEVRELDHRRAGRHADEHTVRGDRQRDKDRAFAVAEEQGRQRPGAATRQPDTIGQDQALRLGDMPIEVCKPIDPAMLGGIQREDLIMSLAHHARDCRLNILERLAHRRRGLCEMSRRLFAQVKGQQPLAQRLGHAQRHEHGGGLADLVADERRQVGAAKPHHRGELARRGQHGFDLLEEARARLGEERTDMRGAGDQVMDRPRCDSRIDTFLRRGGAIALDHLAQIAFEIGDYVVERDFARDRP